MALQSGPTLTFESELLKGQHDFSTDVIKLAIYTNDRTDLDPSITIYDNDDEIETWSEYPVGGVTLTATLGRDSTGAYVDFADVEFQSIPRGRSMRSALMYNSSLNADNSICVLNFGQEYQPQNGRAIIELEMAELSHQPIIRLHTGSV